MFVSSLLRDCENVKTKDYQLSRKAHTSMVGVNIVSPGPSGVRDGTFSSRSDIANCSGLLKSRVVIQPSLDGNVKLINKEGGNTFALSREHSKCAFTLLQGHICTLDRIGSALIESST